MAGIVVIFSKTNNYSDPTGMIVIDYVATTTDLFQHILKFITFGFNAYSNHVSLHFELSYIFNITNMITLLMNLNANVAGKHK